MGIMRLIEGIRAGKAVSVFSGNQEYLFSAGKPGPACPDGFKLADAGRRQSLTESGPGNGPFLFFDSRTNRFLDFTGGLLEALFPMSLWNISMIWLS